MVDTNKKMYCALLDDEMSTRRLQCYRIVPTTHILREDENKKIVKCSTAWLNAQLRKNPNYRETIMTHGTENGMDYKMVKTNIRAMEDSEEKCRQFVGRVKGIVIEDSHIREPLKTINVKNVKKTKRSTVGTDRKPIKKNNDQNVNVKYQSVPTCHETVAYEESDDDDDKSQQRNHEREKEERKLAGKLLKQQQSDGSSTEQPVADEQNGDYDDEDQQPKRKRQKKERQLGRSPLKQRQSNGASTEQPVEDEQNGDYDDKDQQPKHKREEKKRQLAQELSKQQQVDESSKVQPVVDGESGDDDDEEHKLWKQHKEKKKRFVSGNELQSAWVLLLMKEITKNKRKAKKLKAIENKLDRVLEKQSAIEDIVKGTKKAVPPRKLLEEFLHITEDGTKVIKIDGHTIEYDDALRIVNANDMRHRFTLMLNTYMSIEEQAKNYIKLPKDKTECEEAKIFKKTDFLISLCDQFQAFREVDVTGTKRTAQWNYPKNCGDWAGLRFRKARLKTDSAKIAKRKEHIIKYTKKRNEKKNQKKITLTREYEQQEQLFHETDFDPIEN